MNKKVRKMQVIVCQHGGRHRYAIPRILEDAGMLSALYTDSSAHSFLGKCAKFLPFFQSLRRLFRRQIDGVPPEKVFSTDYPLIKSALHRFSAKKNSIFKSYIYNSNCLSKKMISWGVRKADAVYSMNRSNLDFVRYAKNHDCKSIIDVFIGPQTASIMLKEYKLFSDWGRPSVLDDIEFEEDLWREMAEIADILLCPSVWVAEGLVEISPEFASKVKIVPYGCSIDYQGRTNKPIERRVLFAGNNALRKGLHYLAQAATQLKKDVSGIDVRVAGLLSLDVTNHPICKDLNFLGKLTSEQMKEEYLSADVFVLPSLSEGFSSVVPEAIAAGCPVIVTKEAGTPVVHEREGLVIPSRDVAALYGAIKEILENRTFRAKLSESCLEEGLFYSEKVWKGRLLNALDEI